MKKRLRKFWLVLGGLAWGNLAAADVSRTEVIERAKDYAFYPWRAKAVNLTAACHANYASDFVVGDFLGVAYDWGGFDSLFEFSKKIDAGQGAGSPAGGDVTSCTTGVDCSGFVSQTWKTTQKYGTSTLDQISSPIAATAMLAGDAFNLAGTHVTLFSHLLASGEPFMYEAAGFNARVNAFGGWSWVDGYTPRRYQSISGTTVGNPLGTLTNPIVVTQFPFTDSRDTRTAPSDVLDGCAAAVTTNESGPEYIYQVTVTQPGSITVSVADDATADIDVHLMSSSNTSDCMARADATFTKAVDCGTYYVVADTFASAANAGAFDLTVAFSPSGASCGNGPPGYDPNGGLGAHCEAPGHPNLPGCNATLGAEVCLYDDTTSFCTKACAAATDCADFAGGCCAEIGNGEHYCETAALCAAGPTDPMDPTDPTDPTGPTDPSNPSGDDEKGGGGCSSSGGTGGALALLVGLLAFRRRNWPQKRRSANGLR